MAHAKGEFKHVWFTTCAKGNSMMSCVRDNEGINCMRKVIMNVISIHVHVKLISYSSQLFLQHAIYKDHKPPTTTNILPLCSLSSVAVF